MSAITVVLDWEHPAAFTVEHADDGINVLADPGLSEQQVVCACSELEADGEEILRAWRKTVGLDPRGGTSALAS